MAAIVMFLGSALAPGQTTANGSQTPVPAAQGSAPAASSTVDPLPPPNLKNFTAPAPTVATVDAFLKQLWGYDANRIWRVEAIQTTQAPGVARVVVFVTEKSPNAKVETSAFFVTPDGRHAIAGDGVIAFGATPFAEARQQLQSRADGPARGAAGKQLMLVEFADMECPVCKQVKGTVDQLVKEFPNARLVYQNFPLTEIHPFAFKAAAEGVCIAKQKPEAFWTFLDTVYDTQGGLTAKSGEETLKSAVVRAGFDPGAIDLCAGKQATKDEVMASRTLGEGLGVDSTPTLFVNGQMLSISAIPYETLKTIVAYQAAQDGVK